MIGFLRHVLALLFLGAWLPAAAITCTSITSPVVFIEYASKTTASMQGTFTVSCTRDVGDTATSVVYGVVNDGGNSPTASNGGASLAYSLGYTSCQDTWKGTKGGGSTITGTISWDPTSYGVKTQPTTFWVCMGKQTASTAGIYSGAVISTLTYPGGTVSGPLPVDILVSPYCTFTAPPGNISLSYVALGPQVTGSTTFGVQCTTGMPYGLATDVPEGVLNNLRYILSLSSTSANGTGAPQMHTITATIPGGQAGTCAVNSCAAQQAHTITISY